MAKTKYLHCDMCDKRIQCELHREWARCNQCRAKVREQDREEWGKDVPLNAPVRNCLHCGKAFKPARRWIQHCSVKCGKQRSRKHESANARWHSKNIKRHAKAKGSVYTEDVIPSKVFDRDKWICQLCLKPVDPNAPKKSKWSASLDHIIPLTHGGPHTYANVQLAHLSCNSRKGANLSGQLVLI